MKYEAVKRAVAQGIYDEIKNGRGGAAYPAALAAVFDSLAERRTFDASLQALADKAYEIVMRWDVRSVSRMRELFPQHFPKSLSTGVLAADYDDAGDWVVEIART